MLPFIRIFGRALPMYGLLGVLGFLLGLLFILLRAPRFSLKRDDAVYIYVFAVLGALLGAKLVYILTVLPELLALIRSGAGVEELFGYLSGGLVFFGGVLGALPAAYLSARAYRVRFADFLPLLVPCIPLIGALGRVGCFCAGCCWGVESSSCLAVVFPEASLGAPSACRSCRSSSSRPPPSSRCFSCCCGSRPRPHARPSPRSSISSAIRPSASSWSSGAGTRKGARFWGSPPPNGWA